ncbi:MAG: aminotransferase class I/II-fold pyridoxal phosphate-dependent enzyme [Spirochaetota bacterium]
MMELAERVGRLGTETAFAVSLEANAFAARGNTVYPFHLGDINLKTPENVMAAAIKAMQEGKTGYCPNAGISPLREALARDINKSHGTSYTKENVAIQPGGKPVIGKFFLVLMNPGDEVLYPNPGYPIYESIIEFHGGKAIPYGYAEGKENFEIKLEEIERSLTPKTRFLVFNSPQNPMAAESSQDELNRIAELVRKYDLMVLCDEAYFDMRYEGKSQSLVTLPDMEERCVILYTFSKKFAMTGWRLGAAIGPQAIIEQIAKLNVNDESCSNHFIQYGAIEGLTGDQSSPKKIIEILKERRDRAVDILQSIKGIRCFKPKATFYLFPNVTEAMRRKGIEDYNEFRIKALEETGVSFCTRLHFGRALPGEREKYIRLAYAGIDLEQIEEGLLKFKRFIES